MASEWELKIPGQVIEIAFGAGEGNRTLVFSLEVEEFCNVENAGSDILQPWG
jgi:hypothetical protein